MDISNQLESLQKNPVSFSDVLKQKNNSSNLTVRTLKTFQINLGKLCNQACKHCHVDAGPSRTEMMSLDSINKCIEIIKNINSIEIIDITGGAPEMSPHFTYLIESLSKLGKHIIDRCNLTILEEEKYEYLYNFLSSHKVEIVASMPHYDEHNVDKQRGTGVYNKSITALQKLNKLGYGSSLPLNLVYNPVGLYLSASQAELEGEFKKKLKDKHNIIFNNLYCLNNMPISRYLESLIRANKFETYMEILVTNFNQNTVENLMCRDQVSISWDGYIYDCDFNQMLDLKIKNSHINNFDYDSLLSRNIITKNHCFGCTAGTGSSCGGSLT